MSGTAHAPVGAKPAPPAARPGAVAPPRLRRTSAAGGGAPTGTGTGPAFDFGAVLVAARRIQRKPTVNAPGDAFEREADHAAEAVMRSVSQPPMRSAVVSVQRKCARCGDEENQSIQAWRAPAAAPGAALDVGAAVSAARQGGVPLSKETRATFEPRFGHDFSRVRVHADSAAAAAARAVQARAYTLGHDVVFGAGEYAPGTRAGQHLLAHELAHVIQQDGGQGNIQRTLIYGSGYPRPYTADPPEIKDSINKGWYPSSVDMKATADANGGGTAASTFSAFIAAIASQPAASISQLGLIGHSNASTFSLGGTIKPGDNVYFDAAAVISSDSLDQNAAAVAGVKGQFASGAKITLYGCDAGSGTALLDKISQSFGVCVQGFKGPLTWCLSWNSAQTLIVSRGQVAYANPNDPMTQIGTPVLSCSASLTSVTPDAQSCVGVAPTSPAPPPANPNPPAQ